LIKKFTLTFTQNFFNSFFSDGRVSPHHVLPKSGWVSYWINQDKEQEHEISAVIELFKMRYEQLKPRVQTKQEKKFLSNKNFYLENSMGSIRLRLQLQWLLESDQ
jgi:luciferase-like monooxygenase